MCFGDDAPPDRSAEIARAAEDKRVENIRQGTNKVNDAFSQFGGDYKYLAKKPVAYGLPGLWKGTIEEPATEQDHMVAGTGGDYYGGVSKAYSDYYRPLIDEQYGEAKRNLTLNSPGGSGTSAFARDTGNLERDYQRELVSLGDRANQWGADARSKVEGNRAQLLSQLEGGASAESIATRALASAQSSTAPQSYSPIADLFQKYTGTMANARMAANAGYKPIPQLLFGTGGNTNSVSVTNT